MTTKKRLQIRICLEKGFQAALSNCVAIGSREIGGVIIVDKDGPIIDHRDFKILEKGRKIKEGNKIILEGAIIALNRPLHLVDYQHWLSEEDIGFEDFDQAAEFEAEYYRRLLEEREGQPETIKQIFQGALAAEYIHTKDANDILALLADYADDEMAQEIIDYGVPAYVLRAWTDNKKNNITLQMREKLLEEMQLIE